jgi:hypothetical protein
MKLNYFHIGRPVADIDGKPCVSIRLKWWAFPILYFKTFTENYTAGFYGWCVVIFKMPGIWYKWYKGQGE